MSQGKQKRSCDAVKRGEMHMWSIAFLNRRDGCNGHNDAPRLSHLSQHPIIHVMF